MNATVPLQDLGNMVGAAATLGGNALEFVNAEYEVLTTSNSSPTSMPLRNVTSATHESEPWSISQTGTRGAPLVYVNVGQTAPAAPLQAPAVAPPASSDRGAPLASKLDAMLQQSPTAPRRGAAAKKSEPSTNLFVVEHEFSSKARAPEEPSKDPYAVSIQTEPQKPIIASTPTSLWKKYMGWWITLIVVGALGVIGLIIWAVEQHQSAERDKKEQERIRNELSAVKASLCSSASA